MWKVIRFSIVIQLVVDDLVHLKDWEKSKCVEISLKRLTLYNGPTGLNLQIKCMQIAWINKYLVYAMKKIV